VKANWRDEGYAVRVLLTPRPEGRYRMSDIPVFEFKVRGGSATRMAQELRRIADAIENGDLIEESGGMMLMPNGDGITIQSDLKLCRGPQGKSTH